MRIIRTIIVAIALCLIPVMMPTVAHSSIARAQTGAAVSGDENLKITVTPVRKEEGAAVSAVLYRVMGVVLIIWAGLAAYLFVIDRKVARIEQDIRSRK